MKRFCDCCGVELTEENNKQGFDICDKCNEELEKECSKFILQSMKEKGR